MGRFEISIQARSQSEEAKQPKANVIDPQDQEVLEAKNTQELSSLVLGLLKFLVPVAKQLRGKDACWSPEAGLTRKVSGAALLWLTN